jgi:hypothetical protein
LGESSQRARSQITLIKAIEIEIQRIKENAAAEIAQLQAEAGRARAKAIQETRENS